MPHVKKVVDDGATGEAAAWGRDSADATSMAVDIPLAETVSDYGNSTAPMAEATVATMVNVSNDAEIDETAGIMSFRHSLEMPNRPSVVLDTRKRASTMMNTMFVRQSGQQQRSLTAREEKSRQQMQVRVRP